MLVYVCEAEMERRRHHLMISLDAETIRSLWLLSTRVRPHPVSSPAQGTCWQGVYHVLLCLCTRDVLAMTAAEVTFECLDKEKSHRE